MSLSQSLMKVMDGEDFKSDDEEPSLFEQRKAALAGEPDKRKQAENAETAEQTLVRLTKLADSRQSMIRSQDRVEKSNNNKKNRKVAVTVLRETPAEAKKAKAAEKAAMKKKRRAAKSGGKWANMS